MTVKKNHAKIIIFGEYTVLHGSNFLAVPHPKFYCYPTFNKPDPAKTTSLHHFYNYLIKHLKLSKVEFDFSRFIEEINRGLTFHTNIPLGAGYGSSGAFCASLYHRYGTPSDKLEKESLAEHKNNLGAMESYYHGKSSGVDPLVSYINDPIFQDKNGDINILQEEDISDLPKLFYLLNTTKKRPEKKIPTIYENILRDNLFPLSVTAPLLVNKCIDNFLKKDYDLLNIHVKELSLFQLKYFRKLIPDSIIRLWKYGIDSNLFYLKFCGAGGGGNFLVFSKNFEMAKKYFYEFQLTSLDCGEL